jgi:predicted alpha/beta superfamily hydrolase
MKNTRNILFLLSLVMSNFEMNAQIDYEPDTILILKSNVFDNSRAIRVLLPPGYNDVDQQRTRYPVLYLNDGFAVFKFWKAKQTVLNLISSGKIEPFILVGIDNAIKNDNNIWVRTNEYLPYPDELEPNVPNPNGKKYPDFLINEVMPLVNSSFRTQVGSEFTALGGASYGAYISLFTYLHRPNVVSKLLLESAPLFIADNQIIEDAENFNLWKGKIYIGIGSSETTNEAILKKGDVTKEFTNILKKQQVPYLYIIKENAGHNSKAWAERLPEAIEFLFKRE